MTRRAFLVGAASGVLAACGGGAVATGRAASCGAGTLVSFFGDSLLSGGVATSTDPMAPGTHLDPRPVARVVQRLGGAILGIDRSVPGWGAAQHASGWTSTVDIDPAEIVVMRMGGADTIGPTTPAQLAGTLDEMVRIALAKGKRVVLAGLIHVVRRPEWQDPMGMSAELFAEIAAKVPHMDAAVRSVAARHRVPFADTYALPFDPERDIADAVHPAQGYSNRCADLIADAVARLLNL